MMLDQVVGDRTIPSVIAELEALDELAPGVRRGAILILKNVLEESGNGGSHTIVFNQKFVLPSRFRVRIAKRFANKGAFFTVWELLLDVLHWIRGADGDRFRDLCDRCFWRIMVPSISASFGDLADRVLNTINEAIINYAEYSFRPWSVRRRIHVQLFKTDRDLAYVIIRPSGTRLRSFDPLALRMRSSDTTMAKKRGWGHTLLMERALFLSFDHEPKRRGMLIIIGAEDAA